MTVSIDPVIDGFPDGFEAMRAEARGEGYRFLDRLADDWAQHRTRFDRPGEKLLAARVGGALAGIGGLTVDPVVADALRMRRFYVRPSFRRGGGGRALVQALLAQESRSRRTITVNASAGSFLFWESFGFRLDPRDGHSHVRDGA